MCKWILAAGAAALAIATPALAQKEGKGGGGKPDKAADGNQSGVGKQADPKHDGGHAAHAKGADKSRGDKDSRLASRSNGNDHAKIKANDGSDRKRDDNDNRFGKKDRDDFDGRRDARDDDDRRFGRFGDCPPGLAKKDNDCMPPGQLKKVGSVLPAAFASRTLQGALGQWFRDDDRFTYRNDGDYVFRVNRTDGLINALFPMLDRNFSYYPVGMNYPSAFDQYNVPSQFQSFYPDGGNFDYRYGDGAIYQVNPSTNAIQSIVALLAGDLGVGQQLPSSYSAYNVPLAYRDRYYDTPDATYRYNDGYIYRADPKTQLITAVIDAII